MFTDPTIVGCWPTLAARLDAQEAVRRWSATSTELAGLRDLDDLLLAWDDPDRTHTVGNALVRLAAADGGCDGDALLLLLHLLSGVVWRLVGQFRDLSDDITAVVLSELTCQIRTYPWRTRHRGLVANLIRDTRRAVLADLRPSDRWHPDRVERLTWDGDITALVEQLHHNAGHDDDDVDVVDLLRAAVAAGVAARDVALFVESELARGRRGARADQTVAGNHGISRRTLLRRRARTLSALREVAAVYLGAAA